MGLFDLFTKKRGETKISKAPFKRAYAAANTGRLFADFVTSDASADSELKNALPSLRNRSRDLARNNEYARRYFDLMKTNVVGERGFQLQVKALDSVGNLDQSGNDAAEKAFAEWCRRGNCTVDGKMSWVDAQRLAIESVARDGEAFIVLHRGAAFKDSFAIEFIEPDQVDVTLNRKLDDGGEVRMGVELDKFKKPRAYYIKTSHPGDNEFTSISLGQKHKRIPASKVLHVYKHLRAGQTRGEPWLASAIPALKQLGALREAAVINARIGASKMGFFTSESGDGFVPDDLDNNVPIYEAEPGSFHQLPAGVKFDSFDPQYPSSEFDSFHKAVLKGIASGLSVSYTSLSNDLEATSYSSIRQGALEERDAYRGVQSFITEHFVRPVYEAWLASAMEMNTFGIPLRQYERFRDASNFRGKAWSWVDPLKEMNAAVTGLKMGVISLQDVAAQYGKDVEELMAQIARDKALAEQFGIAYAFEPYGATTSPVPPEGYDSDEG